MGKYNTPEELMTVLEDGEDRAKRAAKKALEYMGDCIDNINDPQWRELSVDGRALEIGAGKGAVHIIDNIHHDLQKKLGKKLRKLGVRDHKLTAEAMIDIFIGEFIKQLVLELTDEKL
jgi:hypothetical protein